MTKLIHVVAAAIVDAQGKIFLARRPDDKHQGGLWEFPGGKVEPGESALSALGRELNEELGIVVTQAAPLITVPYHYPDKSVLLEIFVVDQFDGTPWGREGQQTGWFERRQLDQLSFPAANRPIVDAVLLPTSIAISPSVLLSPEQLLGWGESALAAGAGGLMLRLPTAADDRFMALASAFLASFSTRTLAILNTRLEIAEQLQAPALHLSQRQFQTLGCREAFSGRWLGVSCHSDTELQAAQALGANYATLSPVAATQTHPDAIPLGWSRFQALCKEAALPVYGLGGMRKDDIPQAIKNGGQGIAAIRGWSTLEPKQP